MRNSLIRNPRSHKGDYGHALILAGSRGMSGAALLAVRTALRAGAGKVTLATTEDVYRIIGPAIPEAMSLLLPANSNGAPAAASLTKILSAARRMQAVAMGPGIGRDASTAKLVRGLMKGLRCPVVVDADALRIAGQEVRFYKGLKARVILTPHEGELSPFLKKIQSSEQSTREEVAKKVSKQYHCILIRKGNRSLVTDSDGSLYINRTGNPGMASGGTGDVLTGLLAGLLAQGFEPYTAAKLAVYVHGKAGDKAAKTKGQTALIASDIIEMLPAVLKKLEHQNDLSRLLA